MNLTPKYAQTKIKMNPHNIIVKQYKIQSVHIKMIKQK
jgi:hypothetical protein